MFTFDPTNNLNVNLAAGSISGGNAAASPTGAAVPASGDFIAVNIGGNLVGVTGLALGGTTKAADVAIVDGSGNQITSFGGGTQFADNAASGATPTGTLEMGWDSANSKVRALKVNASQALIVDGSAITQPVSGTITANQGGAPWQENITQVGGAAVSLGAKSSANSIPVVLATDEATLPVNIAIVSTQVPILGAQTSQSITTWTNATALNTFIFINVLGYGTSWCQFDITGSITGGTVVFEGADGVGGTWKKLFAAQLSTGQAVSSYNLSLGDDSFQCQTAGFGVFRIRLSTVITGTGSVKVGTNGSGMDSTGPYTINGTVALGAGSAVIGHVIADTGSTTVVTGNVTVVQPTGTNLHAVLDTTSTTAVTQATGTNLHAVIDSGTITVTPPTLTKGTQGATGFSVQDLKDAGRSYLSFSALAAAGVVAEALFSFSQTKQGAVTAGVSSYTITSGKTLRITSISVSVRAAAATVPFSRCALRHNTAGATIATSPIAYLVPEVFGIAATIGVGGQISVPIPDGIEFFGNGTQTIGMSHLDQATTNILNVTLYGFEY